MWNLVHFFLCFYGFDPLKCRKREQKQSQNCTKGSFREMSSPNPHTFLLFTLFSPWKVLIFLVPSFFLMHFLAQQCADIYIFSYFLLFLTKSMLKTLLICFFTWQFILDIILYLLHRIFGGFGVSLFLFLQNVVLHCVNVWFFSAITQIKSFRKSQFQNNALVNNYAYIFLYYLAFFFS